MGQTRRLAKRHGVKQANVGVAEKKSLEEAERRAVSPRQPKESRAAAKDQHGRTNVKNVNVNVMASKMWTWQGQHQKSARALQGRIAPVHCNALLGHLAPELITKSESNYASKEVMSQRKVIINQQRATPQCRKTDVELEGEGNSWECQNLQALLPYYCNQCICTTTIRKLGDKTKNGIQHFKKPTTRETLPGKSLVACD